tara:strand:- start:1871 stop:2743 length:873 start_codon:yes stop_codon:yes gene_type:complete
MKTKIKLSYIKICFFFIFCNFIILTNVINEEISSAEQAESDKVPSIFSHNRSTHHSGKVSYISIVIDDLGHSRTKLNAFLTLPKFITLAFLPYTSNAKYFSSIAYKRGHDILLHLPMEALDSNADPGPTTLKVNSKKKQFLDLLTRNLDSIESFVGVNNHMGSKLSKNKVALQIIMNELSKRNVFYLDSLTIQNSLGWLTARDYGIPFAKRDVFIDHSINKLDIKKQLHKLEQIAHRKGYAVGIGHPHMITLYELSEWIPLAENRGIKFVPLSKIVRMECKCDLYPENLY